MNKVKASLCLLWVLIPLFAFSAARLPQKEVNITTPPKQSAPQAKRQPVSQTSKFRSPQAVNRTIDFTKQIEPIFKAACYQCHAGEKAKAQLRLDAKAFAMQGGVSGKSIVPGNSKDSLLVHRVLGQGDGMRMPPGDPLTKEQTALLRAWIDGGAEWPDTTDASAQSVQSSSATTKAVANNQIVFARDIEPIFKASCYTCHAGEKPKAQLRLDSKTMALKGGISGKVIVPGNSTESRLIHRVMGHGGEARMPLKGEPLAPEQVALLRAWIDGGAIWPDVATAAQEAKIAKHWSYVKPVRPEPPPVKNTAWVRNPIDNFVLARLEKEGLTPAPEASKETLIRRASLDLIGLPPSVREVDDFLSDKSLDAYEKVVDRLLASPHYGERWARPWLDMARYADTNGYEKDRRRSAWKYRDWVIKALNADMPFDQFTVEQMAGDMLPNATAEQKIATGFHRNTMSNEEGGVDQEEARWETVVDRVGTTATVWLGSTLACAQCHNHKYDPFTQKEFYQLFAFFNNTDYGFQGDATISEQKLFEPKLELPTIEQEAKRKEIEAETNKLREILSAQTPELKAAQTDWERAVTSAHSNWTFLDLIQLESTGGATLAKSDDKSVLVSGANSFEDEYIVAAKTNLKNITGILLEALPDSRLPRGGPGRDPYGNFILNDFKIEIAPANQSTKAAPLTLKSAVADDWLGDLTAKDQSSYEFKGWRINASKEDSRLKRQVVFVVDKPIGFDGETLFKIKLVHKSEFGGQGIGRFRLSVTTANDPTTIVNVSAKLRPALDVPLAQRSDEQKKAITDYYRSIAPLLKPTRDRLAELRKATEKLDIVTTLVMQERPSYERPSTFLRIRGSYMNKGEQVFAGVPAVLHPLPESQLSNRLGLARWLVSEENPLTARVTVNRFWEQFFGRGIVETSEDFGVQGEQPTHPELLDWLATEFMRQGWRTKAVHRLIVTSATYRQSSKNSPALLERDPYNKLLARGPRFRIEAEMIRDVALTVSGQLSRKIGGPSVFPHQPEGIWSIPFNDDKWINSQGENRYRRGLYTFIRRTSPYPALVNFDAPSREFCTVRRVRTNTPLQALTALNDPAFFDAARSLAKRIWTEAATDTRARAVYGFRLCVARQPKAEELGQIVAWYEKELAFFEKDANAAKKVVADASNLPAASTEAEIAAWTMVSNVLLNMDGTVTKE